MAIPTFAADTPVEATRIPMGRGQFVMTQLPRAAQPEAAPYALTGQPAYQRSQPSVRLGIRGQTVFVPNW